MTIFFPLGTAFVAAIVSILFGRSWRNFRALPQLPRSTATATPPDCMVIIPARDEAACIARAVHSFRPDTVIVVDDQSSDSTAEEARKAGAGVLPAPQLPKGAVGKSHACMVGARVLTSRWILFADADTWYAEGFLDAAVACAESGGLDLLSIHLTSAPQGWAEQLLVPYLSVLFFTGASLRGDLASVFSGRCLLVRREPYEFVGGHASVLKYPVEDVKLAALAQRHRLRLSVVRAGELGHVRFGPGWRGMWEGVERESLRIALLNPGTATVIVLSAVSAALWLPTLVWLWVDGQTAGQHAAAALLLLLFLTMLRPWYGVARIVLAPLAIYTAIPFVLHGIVRTFSGGPLRWKGRTL